MVNLFYVNDLTLYYEINDLNQKIDIGIESNFVNIWSKKNSEEQIIHKPILNKEIASDLIKRVMFELERDFKDE